MAYIELSGIGLYSAVLRDLCSDWRVGLPGNQLARDGGKGRQNA